MNTLRRASTIFQLVRIPTLFCLAAALQVLDWSSTLLYAQSRHETNRIINFLLKWASFPLIVSAVKACCLAVIGFGYWFWRRHRGLYDFEFSVCLTIVVLLYGVIVWSNYFS